MAKLEINVIEGGLGAISTNVDKFAGVAVHFDTLPSGWSEGQVQSVTRSTVVDDPILKDIQTEFYRLSPNGTLYICTTALAFDATVLQNILDVNDNVRTLGYIFEGVADFTAFNSNLGGLQTFADTIFADINPVRIVAGTTTEFSGSDTIATAPSLSGFERVIPVAASIENKAYLPTATMLGSISSSSVHQKVSWVKNNNLVSDAITTATMRALTGESTTNLGQGDVDTFSDKGYNFWRKYPKRSGVYWADFRSGEITTNDFATANNGRVIDKATVTTYDALQPYLDSPVYVDTLTGVLGQASASQFESVVYTALQAAMVGGLSGDDIELAVDEDGNLPNDTVYVNPNQNVLSTQTIYVQVSITPVGASKNIIVNIGLRNPAAA